MARHNEEQIAADLLSLLGSLMKLPTAAADSTAGSAMDLVVSLAAMLIYAAYLANRQDDETVDLEEGVFLFEGALRERIAMLARAKTP